MSNNTIKAIIVDDERLARNELKKLLEQHPEIQIVDEASNVDEALKKLTYYVLI
jgi:two-component system LytT family response regulator